MQITKLLASGDYGILSADLNRPEQYPGEQEIRRASLVHALEQRGYRPVKVHGNYEGQDEQSFLVPNIDRADLIELGAEFEQDSVLDGRLGLIYVKDGDLIPKTGAIHYGPWIMENYSEITVNGVTTRFQIGLDFDDVRVGAMLV